MVVITKGKKKEKKKHKYVVRRKHDRRRDIIKLRVTFSELNF